MSAKRGCLKNTRDTINTQHPQKREQGISAKRGCLKKNMGYHQYTAPPSMRTQHKCQQRLFTKKNMGYHQYTTSPPMRTQHKCQKGLFKKEHGPPSVHSVPTNENTACVPKEVVLKNMGCHQYTTSPPMRTQHKSQKRLLKNTLADINTQHQKDMA